jgi:hypothetical protein
MALDDFILAAELDCFALKILADWLLQLAFEDALEAFCYAVFPLNLMSVPEPLILTWAGIKRAMLLDFPLALIHLRRADVELGACWCARERNRNTENVR